MIGETLGPYRLKKELGHGGFATVYLALQPNLNRDVAIKVLHPEFIRDERALKRFKREALAIARISHPNIVAVYDYGELDGRAYLVMEYVAGDTLKRRLGKPVSNHFALEVVTAVSAALDYAHSKGLVHRDVKPANILFTEDNRIVLSDFGIVRLADDDSSLTRGVIGTPQYMSPEQALGNEVDGRSDLYSLAIVLFEMLTGRVPFRGEGAVATLSMHVTMPVPSLRALNPALTEEIEAVVQKALAKDPNERFGTGTQLRAALARAIDHAERPIESTIMMPTPAAMPPPAAAHRRELPAQLGDETSGEPSVEVMYRDLQTLMGRQEYAAVIDVASQILQRVPAGYRDVQTILSTASQELHSRTAAAPPESQVQELIAGAQSAIAAARLLTARQLLHQALRLAPGDAQAKDLLDEVERLRYEEDQRRRREAQLAELYAEAQSNITEGNWHGAAENLREIAGIDPAYRDMPAMLRRVRAALGDDESHATPADVVDLRRLAEQAMAEDRWRDAAMLWEQVQEQQPNLAGLPQQLELARHHARILEVNEEAARLVGMGRFEEASRKLDEIKHLSGE